MVEILTETIASIAAIYGALMNMKAVKTKSDKDRYKGFWGFMISNLIIMTMAIGIQAYPLFIQMIAFTIPSTIGLVQLSKNKVIIKIIVLFFYAISLNFINEAIIGFSYENYVVGLDTYAAPIAIIGSFILIIKDLSIRKNAFLMFIMADTIYVYFAIQQGWYILMIQYVVFIMIAVKSYRDSLKKENSLRVAA